MKILKRTLVFVLSVLIFLGIVLLGVRGYFRLSVSSYYKSCDKTFTIPKLSDGFVPQGISYSDNTFYLTGYVKDGSVSPIILVDKSSGEEIKTVYMQFNGKDFCGHAGGIAVYKDYVYIAGGENKEDGCCIYAFSLTDIKNADDNGKITCLGKVSFYINSNDFIGVSFITVHNGNLVVGEFFREENYPTLSSHHITTKSKDDNKGLAVEFAFDDTATFGVCTTPIKAYSITSLVQGMCFNENNVYLSTSYGLAFSHIYKYDLNKITYEKDITVLDESVPLYSLDSSSLVNDIKSAPMSEEIEIVDGKMYTMCESASNKYIFGKVTGGKYCYALNLSKI